MRAPLKMTRFFASTKVGYSNLHPAHWQHIDCTQPLRQAPVGPIYQTKDELLADHERYLRDAGWLRADDELALRVELGRCSSLTLCALRDFINRYNADFMGTRSDRAAVDRVELPDLTRVQAEIDRRGVA